jgi:hypothetical protein
LGFTCIERNRVCFSYKFISLTSPDYRVKMAQKTISRVIRGDLASKKVGK